MMIMRGLKVLQFAPLPIHFRKKKWWCCTNIPKGCILNQTTWLWKSNNDNEKTESFAMPPFPSIFTKRNDDATMAITKIPKSCILNQRTWLWKSYNDNEKHETFAMTPSPSTFKKEMILLRLSSQRFPKVVSWLKGLDFEIVARVRIDVNPPVIPPLPGKMQNE